MLEATVSRAKYISQVLLFGIASRNPCREEWKNKEVNILAALLTGVSLPLEWFEGFVCRCAIFGSNIARTGWELVMHAYYQILGQERIPGIPSQSMNQPPYLLGAA
jgi:hypothetical protein